MGRYIKTHSAYRISSGRWGLFNGEQFIAFGGRKAMKALEQGYYTN